MATADNNTPFGGVVQLYQPSAIEEAYGNYLLSTVFHWNNNVSSFRLGGREAVTFLSNAVGVSRDTLRHIWSAVDIHNTGKLSSPQQFLTVLRCIALAQCGLLDKNVGSVAVVQQCFQQTTYRTDIPLAQFDGYPIPHHLLQQPHQQMPPATTSFLSVDNDDVFQTSTTTTINNNVVTAATDNNAGYNNNNNDVDDDFGDFSTATAASTGTTASVPTIAFLPAVEVTSGAWDALDALVADVVHDAPLPTLPGYTPTTASSLPPTEDSGTSTTSIDQAAATMGLPPSSSSEPPIVGFQNDITTMDATTTSTMDDAFMGSSSHAWTPTLTTFDNNNIGGGGGGSVSRDAEVPAAPSAVSLWPSDGPQLPPPTEESESEGFGDFVDGGGDVFDTGISNNNNHGNVVPADNVPSIAVSSGISLVENNPPSLHFPTSSFGGGEFSMTTGATSAASATTTTTEIQGWSALDALVDIPDAPLPALPTPSSQLLDDTSPSCDDLRPNESESEGFGDFISPDTEHPGQMSDDAVVVPNVPTGSLLTQTNAEIASDLFPAASIEGSNEYGWGALDALTVVPDAPIPSLATFGGEPSDPMVVDNDNNIETAPSIQKQEESESEGFGDFVGNVDDTTPHGDGGDVAIDATTSLWGTTTAAPAAEISPFDGPPAVSSSINDDHGWGALDALTDTMDAPLPSLQTLTTIGGDVSADPTAPLPTTTTNASNSTVQLEGSESEGFGDFVGTGDIDDALVGKHDEISNQEFSTMHPPIAPSGSVPDGSPPDAFGDFPASSLSGANNTGEQVDAFDELERNAPDSTVPATDPLFQNSTHHELTPDESVSEGFGDFVDPVSSAVAVDSLGIQGTTAPNTAATGWGALDDLMNTQDAPLPKLETWVGVGLDETIEPSPTQFSNPGFDADAPPPVVSDRGLDDDFGDFSGVAVESSAQEFVSGSAEKSPFDLFDRDTEPQSELHHPIEMTRADSEYYSAQLRSVGSDSEDLCGFEDAVDTDTEIDNPIERFNFDVNPPVVDDGIDNDGARDMFAPSAASTVTPTAVLEDDAFTAVPTDRASFNETGSTFAGNAMNPPNVDVTGSTFPQSAVVDDVDDDDFGDFEAADLNDTVVDGGAVVTEFGTRSLEVADESFGDFASFGEFGGGETEQIVAPFQEQFTDSLSATTMDRSQIIRKSEGVPDSFWHKDPTTGGRVDFGHCYDAQIGTNGNTEGRVTRCMQLLDILSTSHQLHATHYWSKCMAVASSELERGVALLKDARCLQQSDLRVVRNQLQLYVDCLGEFVRVTRTMTATIADVLLLDKSALLTAETLPTLWSSMSLANDSLAIENLWETIEDILMSRELAMVVPKLESLVEIRRSNGLVDDSKYDISMLCNFTLQPLPADQGMSSSTKSRVMWAGKPYMACSANLLAHKGSFYPAND